MWRGVPPPRELVLSPVLFPMNQEEQAEHENGTTPENEKKQEFQESIDPNLERQVSKTHLRQKHIFS